MPNGSLRIFSAAHLGRGRDLGERGAQPKDPPSFLIDGNKKRQGMEFKGRGLQLPAKISQLVGVLIISFKQNKPAGPDLFQEKPRFAGKMGPRYPHHKKLPQGLFEGAFAHPVFQVDPLS